VADFQDNLLKDRLLLFNYRKDILDLWNNKNVIESVTSGNSTGPRNNSGGSGSNGPTDSGSSGPSVPTDSGSSGPSGPATSYKSWYSDDLTNFAYLANPGDRGEFQDLDLLVTIDTVDTEIIFSFFCSLFVYI
jgi:hypothetical protein